VSDYPDLLIYSSKPFSHMLQPDKPIEAGKLDAFLTNVDKQVAIQKSSHVCAAQ
jgi:hypothetical protein